MNSVFIYIFCISIIIQAALGQYLLFDSESGAFISLPAVISHSQGEVENSHSLTSGIIGEKTIYNVSGNQSSDEENTKNIKFLSDSIMEHLFSPSNCSNKTNHFLTSISFFHTIKCNIDLVIIEEQINNYLHYYSFFSKNIRIGLPITKMIYPFHNFY